jgi:hypothetical protein
MLPNPLTSCAAHTHHTPSKASKRFRVSSPNEPRTECTHEVSGTFALIYQPKKKPAAPAMKRRDLRSHALQRPPRIFTPAHTTRFASIHAARPKRSARPAFVSGRLSPCRGKAGTGLPRSGRNISSAERWRLSAPISGTFKACRQACFNNRRVEHGKRRRTFGVGRPVRGRHRNVIRLGIIEDGGCGRREAAAESAA